MSDQPEIDATRIEVNRLRRLLRRYDLCECGELRSSHVQYLYHSHKGSRELTPSCRDGGYFRLKLPADPLETVVDGRALSEMVEDK